MRRIGERLFTTVFTGAVAEAFRTSVERVRGRGLGLRLCLRLDQAPELAALPWEALWDPTARAFLADRSDLPIVRTLDVASEAPAVDAGHLPLRLSALLPEPRGEGKLSGEEEWRRIRAELAPLVAAGALAIDEVEPPTLDGLGRRLDAEPCHLLHVVAHGAPGATGSGGVLKLENATGAADNITGGELARALIRGRSTRLVVLNCCHGARSTGDDAFDGLAQHLVSQGIPAVVAMRTSISDAAAVSFAAALYRELAAGRTIEGAVVEARRALSLGEHRGEWATPTLYLRGENVRLLAESTALPLLSPPPHRRKRWPAMAACAALIAVAVAWLLPEREHPQCPAPAGLDDLEFVLIEPDVVLRPQGPLTIEEPFCIATTETTRRMWREVTGEKLPQPGWSLDRPVTHVTPEEVDIFLDLLSARDPESTYRLPTAEEWEFAARAGSVTDFFFGDDPADLDRFGNCRNVLRRDGFDGPAPVKSFAPNANGLYDVHGNVAEWVTWPEERGEQINEKGQAVSLRLGGSFNHAPRNCTFGIPRPVVSYEENRDDTGFRIVREFIQEEDA